MARDPRFMKLALLIFALTIACSLCMSDWAFGAELLQVPDGRTLQCFETDAAARLYVDLEEGKRAKEVVAAQAALIEALKAENATLARRADLFEQRSAQQDRLIAIHQDGEKRNAWLRPVENAAYTLGGIGFCVGSAWAMGQVAN